MKLAFGFTSDFYEDDEAVQKLAEKTVDCVPIVIVDWNYPVIPTIGEYLDIELLESFPEIPRELIQPYEFKVEYVYWTMHDNQPIPMVQLRGT